VGPDRTDYAFVAQFICPDGTMPLAGDASRGASVRLGTVGQTAAGHVIDEYEVPCRPTPQRVYVDAYNCAEGVADEIDPENVTPEQLAEFARYGRAMESHPFGERVEGMRLGLAELLVNTEQMHLDVCPALFERIATDDYRFAQIVRAQFIVSLGAGVIETSSTPEHRLRNNVLAIEGLSQLYAVMLQEAGQVAAFGALDEVMRARSEQRLEALVASWLAECDAPPALGFVIEGENPWPPTGPGCAELVACCEGAGFVRNGAATATQPAHGLMCLMSAAGDAECEGSLAASRGMGACSP
jgi:hypothetical protein